MRFAKHQRLSRPQMCKTSCDAHSVQQPARANLNSDRRLAYADRLMITIIRTLAGKWRKVVFERNARSKRRAFKTAI